MHNFTKSLPTEVWLVIFGYLSFTGTLGQCRLVCRSWRPLVDKVAYKELNLVLMPNNRLEKLAKCLAMRPELGRLIQEIAVLGLSYMWPQMYRIFRYTPNLKVIEGEWSEILVNILQRPECLALKLEELPCIEVNIKPLYIESMLRFKDTLRSATFKFCMDTPYDYPALSNTLNQLQHLQQLTIEDYYAFRSIRDLDHLLKNCNQIQHLHLDISQGYDYIHTNTAELEHWFASSVQRVETVKTLAISFDDDSLADTVDINYDGSLEEEKQPRDIGPDWMYYLAYKYPRLTRLEVESTEYRRQHLILPKSMHMDTFVLKDWKFYDMDVLKQFIDMLATPSAYIKFEVNYQIHRVPYICVMNVEKKAPTGHTTFSIQIAYDDNMEANTTSVMSLFSSRLIKKFEMNLSGDDHLGSICAAMKCSLNVQSFKITTYNRLLTEYPEQPIFTVLHRLEIVNTRFKSDFMTQLSKYTPNLTHLTLDNCAFEDRVSMPSIQLASLSLQITKGEDMVHRESRGGMYLLFEISTSKYPEQMFLAMPQKPLQRVTKGEVKFLKAPTIYIECGSLKHLSVDLEDIKFEMKFDDADNLIEQVDIEDSYSTILEQKVKALEEEHKKLEARIKLLEDKVIENSVSPPRN